MQNSGGRYMTEPHANMDKGDTNSQISIDADTLSLKATVSLPFHTYM